MAFQQAGLFDWRTVDEEHRAAAGAEGMGQGATARACAGDARSGQALGLRRPHAVAAVRRDAATGRDRPRARRSSVVAADGRAVRRARRDDARTHAGRAAADLRRDRRPPSSSSPTRSPRRCTCRPGRRDVAAAGPDHGRDRRAISVRSATTTRERIRRSSGRSPRSARRSRGHADVERSPTTWIEDR